MTANMIAAFFTQVGFPRTAGQIRKAIREVEATIHKAIGRTGEKGRKSYDSEDIDCIAHAMEIAVPAGAKYTGKYF